MEYDKPYLPAGLTWADSYEEALRDEDGAEEAENHAAQNEEEDRQWDVKIRSYLNIMMTSISPESQD